MRTKAEGLATLWRGSQAPKWKHLTLVRRLDAFGTNPGGHLLGKALRLIRADGLHLSLELTILRQAEVHNLREEAAVEGVLTPPSASTPKQLGARRTNPEERRHELSHDVIRSVPAPNVYLNEIRSPKRVRRDIHRQFVRVRDEGRALSTSDGLFDSCTTAIGPEHDEDDHDACVLVRRRT